jgi:mono/diheme cytochrome c family protein
MAADDGGRKRRPRKEDVMKRVMGVVAGAVMTFTVAVAARAQQPATQTAEAVVAGPSGDSVFRSYCGSCHGASARGDGPLADALRHRPADLTGIAKRNGGKFEATTVHRIIDGRKAVKGHGGTDMPVWGDAFKQSSDGYSEEAVKARIEALVEYLESIQVK